MPTTRNALVNIVSSGALPLATVITAPVLSNVLGVDARGEFAAVSAPYNLLVAAATFGLADAVTYYVARRNESARVVTRRALKLTAAFGVAAALAVMTITMLTSPKLEGVSGLLVVATGGVVPALLIGVLRARAAGLHDWTRVAAERGLTAFARVVGTGLLAVLSSLTVATATAVYVCAPLLGLLAYIQRGPSVTLSAEFDVPTPKLLNYGARVWIGAVFGIVLARLDQLIMIPLTSSRELGLYAVAVNIGEVPLVVTSAIAAVVLTRESGAPDNNAVAHNARITLVIVSALSITIGATLPFWLTELFGKDFRGAIAPTILLLVALVLGTPGTFAGVALTSRGRPGIRSLALVAACAINAVVLVALVPQWGAAGAAVATICGNLTAASLVVFASRQLFGLQPRKLVLP